MPEAWSIPHTPRVVLVVEDDADVRGAAVLLLRRQGLTVREAASPGAALGAIAAEPIDAVLLDLNFRRGATSGEEGLACLAELRAAAPSASIVVVTAHSGVAMAVAAMRAGAVDFVTKPWSNRKLAATMQAAADRGRAERLAVSAPQGEVYLGESAAAQRVRDLVRKVGPLDASVLVWGPAGAGKSLIARLLHLASSDASASFAEIDVGARGVQAALDAFQNSGLRTVALDKVEALDRPAQAVLAAALASPRISRVVAQSREPLSALRGLLGGDLVYRLAAVEIEAPPLHRRGDDAAGLAGHWLAQVARRRGLPVRLLPPETIGVVTSRAWADDARGLRLLIERAALLGDGPVRPEELAGDVPAVAASAAADLNLMQAEKVMVGAALRRWSFNVSHAARELGLTRGALYRRMAKHGF